jgi:hypothetical protein
MIVPKYWAEASARQRTKGRQMTVRRFGWSDAGQEEAQRNADDRAREALARLLAGEKIDRREKKVPYNGAQGVPIREEVVSVHGEAVVTRNIYGALCINTPNVLFADVDLSPETGVGLFLVVALPALAVAIFVGIALASWITGCVLCFVSFPIAGILASALRRIYLRSGSADRNARRRIRRFVDQHPAWLLHVYRTPAGFRVLAAHRTFDPTETEVARFFKALGTDPIYVRMCLNQRCFRARVSPKPWRIGIEAHIKPRPGVWPVAPERLAQRTKWIEDYERRAAGYASCAYLESAGRGLPDPAAEALRRLHDNLSRAASGLPTA